MLAQDTSEEVLKAWDRRFLDSSFFGRFISTNFFISNRLIGRGGGFGAAQSAVVVILGVAVGIWKDDAVLSKLWGLDAGRWSKLSTAGIVGMAEGCIRSLRARLDWGAVLVIVHIAVIAFLGLAADTKPVAYLVG